MDGSFSGTNGLREDGLCLNLTHQRESHFYVYTGFANTTPTQVTETTSGRTIESRAAFVSEISLTAFSRGSTIQMVNSRPRDILKYIVARSLVVESAQRLRSLSENRHEAVILWAGKRCGEKAWVTRIIVPYQQTSRSHFEVPLHERLRIIKELAISREMLLVQLHTHPCEAFHSLIDDRIALPRHAGAISIVVANFAVNWNGDLQQASVNHHLGNAVWQELNRTAVSLLFEVQ